MQRHPDDPEPVPATKARAAWWLGLVALLTGPLIGGVVPGTVALVLVAQFRRDAYPAGGFLTGAASARRGERLAWIGILLAAATVLAVVTAVLLRAITGPPAPDFGPTVD